MHGWYARMGAQMSKEAVVRASLNVITIFWSNLRLSSYRHNFWQLRKNLRPHARFFVTSNLWYIYVKMANETTEESINAQTNWFHNIGPHNIFTSWFDYHSMFLSPTHEFIPKTLKQIQHRCPHHNSNRALEKSSFHKVIHSIYLSYGVYIRYTINISIFGYFILQLGRL